MRTRRGVTRRIAAVAATSAAIALMLAMPAASVAKGPKGFFGVSPAVIVGLDELSQMQRAGITTVRFPFFWPILQPEARRGRPMSKAINFPRFDPLMLEAAKRGIKVFPFVYGTPSYLTPGSTTPPTVSKSVEHEWALLLRALKDRYGPGGTLWKEHPEVDAKPITAWQIWNEPSSASFWKPVSKSPEGYAKLLEISSRALKGDVPPGGRVPVVVAAGLFGSPTHGIDLPTFLDRFYAVKGVKNHFDALAVHPYAPGINGMKLQIHIARTIMRQNGDGTKPLWVSEIGWPTGGNPQNPFYKTVGQQANLLRRTFTILLNKRRAWRIRHVIWYTWRDNSVNTACDLCQYSGLFDADLNPKPAWPAFVHFSGGRL